MAYLDLSAPPGQPAAVLHDLTADTPDASAHFGALEWQVVAIAQHDRLSSLRAPNRLSVILGILFGGERASPRLADPKLEALRRMAVLAWHKGYMVPREEIRAFHAAGYSVEQLEALLARISRGRSAMNDGHLRASARPD